MSGAVRVRAPSVAELAFLRQLRPGEMMTRGELGCVVMGAEARARQSCRRRGWATYEGRFSGWLHDGWVLTEEGAKVRAVASVPVREPSP